ncbi:hypothetical protein ABIE37_000378 [Arthrobacter bambusae]|uniref:Uncharacterized protein n=1 Tax=Arthrobacter bambusae TaxID=1338426 RepID=A0ABV2P1J7_9MICC
MSGQRGSGHCPHPNLLYRDCLRPLALPYLGLLLMLVSGSSDTTPIRKRSTCAGSFRSESSAATDGRMLSMGPGRVIEAHCEIKRDAGPTQMTAPSGPPQHCSSRECRARRREPVCRQSPCREAPICRLDAKSVRFGSKRFSPKRTCSPGAGAYAYLLKMTVGGSGGLLQVQYGHRDRGGHVMHAC